MNAPVFLGFVRFHSFETLAKLAEHLASVTHIAMAPEGSGRYEEVPAYVGKHANAELTLFGAPEGHQDQEAQLEVSWEGDFQLPKFGEPTLEFFSRVFVDKTPNARGFVDCSEELVKALELEGFTEVSTMTG